jgi:hypothetical protein
MRASGQPIKAINRLDPEFDDLLHPAQAFGHPQDVVKDPDLTLDEKRAILAAWASDACAVEASPALRRAGANARAVDVGDIFDALRWLDRQSRDPSSSWARRQIRRASFERFRDVRASDGGASRDLTP